MATVIDEWNEHIKVVGKGKREKKYYFTASAIGILVGKKKRTIQEYIKQEKLDPNKLSSVIDFVNKAKKRRLK